MHSFLGHTKLFCILFAPLSNLGSQSLQLSLGIHPELYDLLLAFRSGYLPSSSHLISLASPQKMMLCLVIFLILCLLNCEDSDRKKMLQIT